MVRHYLRQRHPQVWAFLGRRLSPGEYLGLHLTVGLLVSLAAIALFGLIANNALGGSELTAFDHQVANELHAHALTTPAAVAALRFITELGSLRLLTGFAVLVALLLLARRHRLLALVWLLALAGGGLLDSWLKELFPRNRPVFNVSLVHEPTLSFPSGHSMGSIVSYGMLAYLLVLVLPSFRARVAAVTSLALLVLAIGFSRIYLGAHWFSDVLGGFAAGGVWLAFCISGIEVVRRRRHHRRLERVA